MDDIGANLFLLIVFGFAMFFIKVALTKSEDEKEKEFKEKQRANALKVQIDAEKLRIKKQRLDDFNEASQIVGRSLGEAFKTTSKLVSDSTQKLRKNINLSISKHFLTSYSWVSVNETNSHVLFTFKTNNELIITKNGNVEKGNYELLGQNKSILITQNSITEHYNFINIKNDYFFLNKVSTSDVIAFVNQEKFNDDSRSWFLTESNNLKDKLV